MGVGAATRGISTIRTLTHDEAVATVSRLSLHRESNPEHLLTMQA